MPGRNRNWVFTLNNWTMDEYRLCQAVITENCIYGIIGKEMGAEGTPHLQGALCFKNARTMGGIKRLIGDRVHLEVMHGTPEESKTYCSKEGDSWEYGKCPEGQGTRGDLAWVREKLEEGKSEDEIVQKVENMQQIHYLKALNAHRRMRKLNEPPEVIWHHGPSGSGKTKAAYEYSKDNTWANGDEPKWFDGYCGQETAILDDFEANQMTLKWFLRLTDRYPLRVQVKGSTTPWTPKRIVITALEGPNETFRALTPAERDQVIRRITRVREFPEGNDP